MTEREPRLTIPDTARRVGGYLRRRSAGRRARESRKHIDSVRPDLVGVAEQIVQSKLTYLPSRALIDLASAVVRLEKQGVPGAIVEAGVALGGSAIMLARAKSIERPLLLFDVFGLIPAPGAEDGEDVHARYRLIASGESPGIGGEPYYGYRRDLLAEVQDNLARFNVDVGQHVRLIVGLFEQTMIRLREPIALVHLDSDWYASTQAVLRFLAPLVSRGGRLVVDDYSAWSGCRRAVDEFLASPLGGDYCREWRTRLHLVRTRVTAHRHIS